MQLVLPKGKVRQPLWLFFSPLVTGHSYRFKKMKKMEITVNNQTLKLTGPSSVAQLLTVILQIPGTGIAIAVNRLLFRNLTGLIICSSRATGLCSLKLPRAADQFTSEY
jgi:hypothetical protein